MNAYTLPLSCPQCGSELEPITQGVPVGGTEVSAIARCVNAHCHYEWQVVVRLLAVGKIKADRKQPCGTNAGYVAHRRRGEIPDLDCMRAHCQFTTDTRPSRAKVKVDA